MRTLILTAALVMPVMTRAGEQHDASITAPANNLEVAADEIAATLQTGSLLFSEGDCLAVRVFTASSYTHVAIVVRADTDCLIYDSMNGAGVRKQSLRDYLKVQAPETLHTFHPHVPLTPEHSERLTAFLDSQLGRPYAIQHHLTGERAEGVHCAEYVTDALMAIERLHAEQPAKVSPASLVKGITRHQVYDSSGEWELPSPAPGPPSGATWCEQMWIDTKFCCASCCDKLTGWFLCR